MGKRFALIVGNSVYQDQTLARLKAPDVDVGALHDVLKDYQVGGFDDVDLIFNSVYASVRIAISSFFARKSRDDLLVLYFSGHGVLDANGRLYLAVKDTNRSYLRATAIPTVFITDEMDNCRSRRQVLVLDCCHSGAFARGSKGSTGASVGIANAFEGKGYGRVILTASDATQYAWEGDRVIGEAENSVFTHYLVQGLQTGEADADGDGKITVDELYDYVYKQVISQTPNQTPGKWSYREQGEIVIARAPGRFTPQSAALEVPEFEDEIEDKLKSLFDSGLAAYWLEEWEKAIRAFQAIVEVRPGYPGVVERLRDAQRQAEMAALHETALSALEAEQWDQAIKALEALSAQVPDDQDLASQLAFAQERQRLEELYAQARSLARAEKWRAAQRVLSKISENAPDYPDEEGLEALVEENINALERREKVETLYRQALMQIDEEDLEAARRSLSDLQKMQPGYAESERLLGKVESDIEHQAGERHLEPARQASQAEADALVSGVPRTSEVIRPWHARPLSFIRAHPWLSLASIVIVLLSLIGLASYINYLNYLSDLSALEDAGRIAFYFPLGDSDIYVMNADGSDQTRLTNNSSFDAFPAWSPDGTRIAFQSDRDGNHEIYIMNADGSDQNRLTNNPAEDTYPAWSPDGTRIAFQSDRDNNPEIYVMNANGSDQTRLTNDRAGYWTFPAWSPDSTRIAFGSDRGGSSGIYVMNADGSDQNRLADGSGPAWSPDGTRIAFQSDRDNNPEIYVMNADGSDQTRLTDNPAEDFDPAWSPDGAYIAFNSRRDGNNEIYIMNADGSQQTRVTNDPKDSLAPVWQP